MLRITVFEQSDLDTMVRVTNNEISFPLLGNVGVGSLTTSACAKKIEALLEKDYLVNPRVSVLVQEYHSRQVFVLGAVQRPGSYALPNDKPTTVLEAIAMAQGFKRTAIVNDTKIIRKKDGVEQTIKIRVSDITDKGEKNKDEVVHPNDVIFVPEGFF